MLSLLLGYVVTFISKAYYTSTTILFFSELSVTHSLKIPARIHVLSHHIPLHEQSILNAMFPHLYRL
jgi:hypothetical protein